MTDTVNGVEDGIPTDRSNAAAEPLINADGTPTPRLAQNRRASAKAQANARA